ncbi:hypothetical protein TanjilG_00310 [Lupinus angustifolius]|uniref:AIG1-type G domain-containing protein n=1 Tax=Lupinus angustifolius TaxID=3871 RepID=A0A1J7G6P9_LUPAN|nr:hypothetical protein TanjilG_00310 [Lupinus angustifolius]
MASQIIREWSGINTFASATQKKLLELLGKLKQEDVNSLTILVMGKGGVGKSSTLNSIIGERVVSISPFQSEGPRPVMVSRSRAGFTLNIIDTPGLIEGGYINDMALDIIKRFLLNKTIDVLLYVDRLDAYRVDNLDKLVAKAITDSFGKGIWNKAIIALTHAQFSPPDGLPYDEFVSKRSEALLKVVRAGAHIKKDVAQFCTQRVNQDSNLGCCMARWHSTTTSMLSLNSKHCTFNYVIYDGVDEEMDHGQSEEAATFECNDSDEEKIEGYDAELAAVEDDAASIPVVLVENSGRCNTNDSGEKVLPNGTAWIPHLVQTITETALNESESIHVDKNLIEGPNPNQRGKLWIPLVFALQYFFVMKPIKGLIRRDIAKESRPAWEMRDAGFRRRDLY